MIANGGTICCNGRTGLMEGCRKADFFVRKCLDGLRPAHFATLHMRVLRAVGSSSGASGELGTLGNHPLLGRDAEDGRRELVLLRGRDGHVAKCRWLPAEEIVLILAVRHHREAGYSEE